MKNYQNRLDRFGAIAKRLVDDQSAELFNATRRSEETSEPDETFRQQLNVLGKKLDEHATDFIKAYKEQNEAMRAEIWSLCSKYLDLFVKRNEPTRLNNSF